MSVGEDKSLFSQISDCELIPTDHNQFCKLLVLEGTWVIQKFRNRSLLVLKYFNGQCVPYQEMIRHWFKKDNYLIIQKHFIQLQIYLYFELGHCGRHRCCKQKAYSPFGNVKKTRNTFKGSYEVAKQEQKEQQKAQWL